MLWVGVRFCDTRWLLDVAHAGPAKAAKDPRGAPALASMPLGAYGGEAATLARVRRLEAISSAVEALPYNRAELTPVSDLLIVAVGAAFGPTRDALLLIGMESTVQLVKIGT